MSNIWFGNYTACRKRDQEQFVNNSSINMTSDKRGNQDDLKGNEKKRVVEHAGLTANPKDHPKATHD